MDYRVDRNTLRTNQAMIVAMTVLAFVLGVAVGRWLLLATALVMLLGTAHPAFAVFKQLHQRLLRPLGILGPDVHPEDPMPHQFAQAMGGAVLLVAVGALLGGAEVAGWTLNFVVTALALVNLTVSFCAGCFVYFQLDRRGWLPGAIASGRQAR